MVEGAAPGAANIASADGHSLDGTLDSLRAFKADEDPDDKLTIVTRDGFWSEKDEMSQAYARRATGDYLWQVDVDEFYQPRDIEAICDLLREQPSITAVSFESVFFWAAPDYRVDSWYLRRGEAEFHRLFKWGEGYRYVTHRPPTVVDARADLRRAALDPREGSRRAASICITIPCCCPSKCAKKRVLQPGGVGAAAGRAGMGGRGLFRAARIPITRIMSTNTRAACIASRARIRRRSSRCGGISRSPQSPATRCGPRRYRGAARFAALPPGALRW